MVTAQDTKKNDSNEMQLLVHPHPILVFSIQTLFEWRAMPNMQNKSMERDMIVG